MISPAADTYTMHPLFYRVHELERERLVRLFSKHSEFRADGFTLEEVNTDLNEKRREESERFIEFIHVTRAVTSLQLFSCYAERELIKNLSRLRHQVVKFKKLLRDIKSTTTCKLCDI